MLSNVILLECVSLFTRHTCCRLFNTSLVCLQNLWESQTKNLIVTQDFQLSSHRTMRKDLKSGSKGDQAQPKGYLFSNMINGSMIVRRYTGNCFSMVRLSYQGHN